MEGPDEQQVSAAEALQSVRSRGPIGRLVGPGSVAAAPWLPATFGLLGPNGLLGGGMPAGRSFNQRMRGWNDEVAQGQRSGLTLADAMRWADAQEGPVPADMVMNATTGGDLGPNAARALRNLSERMRMSLAVRGGFERQPWYHATTSDFREFDPAILARMDQRYPGSVGFWLAEHPQAAERFAVGDGANVMPLRVRLGRHGSFDWDPRMSTPSLTGTLRDARDAGLDTVIIRGYGPGDIGRDGLPVPRTNAAVVFDPRNIRSVHAGFDPTGRGSADLLRGLVPFAPGSLLPWVGRGAEDQAER